MNWIDLVLLIILAIFILRGISKGLFREVFALAGIFVGVIVSINRYAVVGEAINQELPVFSLKLASLIAFVLIFVGIALLGVLLGAVLHSMARRVMGRLLDGGGGALVGLLEGALICSVILLVVSVSPLSGKVSKWTKGSALAPYLMRLGPSIYDGLMRVTPGEAKTFMEKLKELDHLQKLRSGNKA